MRVARPPACIRFASLCRCEASAALLTLIVGTSSGSSGTPMPSIAAPGGELTPTRGRPSSYTPELAQRVRELVGQGWSATSICAAIGIDRSTLYRWRAQHPEHFCDTRSGVFFVDKKELNRATFETETPESEFCDTPPTPDPGVFSVDKKEGDPCGHLSDPEPEDPVYGDLVMVVSARRKPAPATPTPLAPPARRDPNAQRPPPHWLRNDGDLTEFPSISDRVPEP
jgi:hypothetical protein